MYKLITIIFLGLFVSYSSYAQDKNIAEADFAVSGVCEMCKIRIENAALIKGVKKVNWDKNAQSINVIYRKDKVELIKIHQAIASAGHDTSEIKAEEDVYKKIPGCCAYRDGVEVH